MPTFTTIAVIVVLLLLGQSGSPGSAKAADVGGCYINDIGDAICDRDAPEPRPRPIPPGPEPLPNPCLTDPEKCKPIKPRVPKICDLFPDFCKTLPPIKPPLPPGPVAACNKLPVCPAPSKVDTWPVPPGGGSPPKGSPDRVLLMVANTVISGPINARELRYKGVVMIGATFQMQGRQNTNGPKGTPVSGGDVMTITFAQGIPSPFIFLANIDYHNNTSYWGDFIRTGTKLNASKNNFSEWVDVSLSNTRIDGHYFWSSSSPGMGERTHSDIFQSANGGWRSLAVCNVQTAWTGQGFYVVPTRVSPNAHPDGQVTLDNVVMGPKADSKTFYGGGHHDVKYVAAYNANVNLATGNYYPVRLRNVYFRPHDSQRLPSMYGPAGAFTGTPVLTSSPPPVVNVGMLGAAGRVADAASLLSYCGP